MAYAISKHSRYPEHSVQYRVTVLIATLGVRITRHTGEGTTQAPQHRDILYDKTLQGRERPLRPQELTVLQHTKATGVIRQLRSTDEGSVKPD